MTDDDRRAIQDAVMETMLDNDHNGLGRCYGGAPTPIVGARVAAALDPWLADHDRAVRVAALTEAADELQRADYEWENAADFVRARASAL